MGREGIKYDDELLLKLKAARAFLKPILTTIKTYSDYTGDELVDHMMDRIKTPESALEKLERKGLELTTENLYNELNDLVGFRVICPFRDDVFKLVSALRKSGLEIVEYGDYVNYPKKSGYTSYHLDVLVPIVLNGKAEKVKCEIQVRSMAMDLWATQEHDLRYKANSDDLDSIEESFSRSGKFLDMFDQEMNYLRNLILENKKKLPEPDKENKPDHSHIIDGQFEEFEHLHQKHELAKNKIESKLQRILLNYEYIYGEKVVNHSKSRIKSDESALCKLERKGLPLSVESIDENLGDMVGIRLICPFITDVYSLVKFMKESDLEFDGEDEDYIENPKESGYSSYHLHVNVPISIKGKIEYVRCEIQVRTIAMDLWATLEHKLRHDVTSETYNTLREDFRSRAIHIAEYDSEVDELYRKAKNLDDSKGAYVLKG